VLRRNLARDYARFFGSAPTKDFAPLREHGFAPPDVRRCSLSSSLIERTGAGHCCAPGPHSMRPFDKVVACIVAAGRGKSNGCRP